MADRPKLVDTLRGPDDGRDRIVDGDRTFTLGQVRAEVARTRAELRDRGLRAGDRVLALLDHDPEAAFLYAAASALGLRLMMPYGLQAAALPEWLSIAAAARPDAVVHQKRDRTGLDALRDRCDRVVVLADRNSSSRAAVRQNGEIPMDHPEPIDGFVVLFSSGTTGAPKAISIAEELVVRKIGSITGRLGFGPGSRIFMSGLMNNTTGVIFTFGGLVRGATVVFPQDHRPASWPAQVAAHGATHVQLRPVALREFVAAAAADDVDLSCLEVMAYGGGSVPRALLEQGRELIAAEWVQGYGLSETYGPFSWLGEEAHVEQRYRKHVYDVGRPDGTVEVRLDPVDGHPEGVGEVLVRGAVMEGYLDVATGTVHPPGAWFRTGDLAEWSPDGDLVLKGRMAGALLTRNGHRIYPEEIEAVLADVPGADDVLLVGIAEDGTVGAERPVACLQGPIGDGDPAEVRSAVAGVLERSLSPEKWPERLLVRTEPFPKSANGKTMRGEVAKLIDPGALIELVP